MPVRIISRILFTFFVLMVFFSCDDKQIYDSYKSTPNRWHKDSLVEFTFKAPDTIKPYNLYLNLRNTHQYPFSNLFLITTLRYP
ncbi:MAG: gliding motility lipoprotein GldH, partial [Bacteroidota bacterium]